MHAGRLGEFATRTQLFAALDHPVPAWACATEDVGGRKSAVEKARAHAYFCRAPRALAMI
jgi:hypothetical protein